MKKYNELKDIKNVKIRNRNLLVAILYSGAISILATNLPGFGAVLTNSIDQDDVLSDEKQIDFDDLRIILNNNNVLDDIYKPVIANFINYLEKYYPNTDLNKFAYNLKDLTIDSDILSDIQNDLKDSAAFYNDLQNKISIKTDYAVNELVLFHELTHTCTECFYDNYLISSMDDNNDYGRGVLEMLTDYFSTRDWPNSYGYSNLKEYAEAIVTVAEFSFDDFCNGGVYLLEERLNSKGLDAKQIISYLDKVLKIDDGKYQNKYEFINEFDSKYSIDLVDTCYKKVLDDFKNSNYDSIIDYLCHIKSNLPGLGQNFNSYMFSNCEEYKEAYESKDIIVKNYIKSIINYKLNIDDNMRKYNIRLYDSTNKDDLRDKYKLCYSEEDKTTTIDCADELLNGYRDYLDHIEKCIINNNMQEELEKEKDDLEVKNLAMEIMKIEKKLINEYKRVYDINEELNIKWYKDKKLEEKIKEGKLPFFLLGDNKYYFTKQNIKGSNDLYKYFCDYCMLYMKRKSIIDYYSELDKMFNDNNTIIKNKEDGYNK